MTTRLSELFGVVPLTIPRHAKGMKPPVRILFVCLGNICRSPSAEIIFRELVKRADLNDHFEIDSAGTLGFHNGAAPDPRMADTLTRRGYSVRGSARKLTAHDLERFDYVIAMDDENLADIRELDPANEFGEKIQPMTRYCTQFPNEKKVPDPYYGELDGFEKVADLLEDACAGLLEATRPRG